MKSLQLPELLPSYKEMLQSYEEDLQQRNEENIPNRKMHEFLPLPKMFGYFRELEKIGDLKPTPPVILKLGARIFYLIVNDYARLRRYNFKILDDEMYEETLEEKYD